LNPCHFQKTDADLTPLLFSAVDYPLIAVKTVRPNQSYEILFPHLGCHVPYCALKERSHKGGSELGFVEQQLTIVSILLEMSIDWDFEIGKVAICTVHLNSTIDVRTVKT
jgi:hypothetical protein